VESNVVGVEVVKASKLMSSDVCDHEKDVQY